MEPLLEGAEIIADPVGHISISGIHGRDELDERASRTPSRARRGGSLGTLILGVAIGATLMYIFDPMRGNRPRELP